MRAFVLRSLITLGVFALSAGMIRVLLWEMPEAYPVGDAGKPEPASSPTPAAAVPAVPAPAPGNLLAELNDTMASVVERTLPGVVSIEVERVRTVTQTKIVAAAGGLQKEVVTKREQSVGSGTIVSASGYVITNWHVVAVATGEEVHIRVMLHGDDEPRAASLIDRDESLDIALLHIEPKSSDETFPFLVFGDSDLMRQAYFVIAVGSPLKLAETVTLGIISNRSRRVSEIQTSFFQVDCAINPGNSGGPLVNLNGELIGINARLVVGPQDNSAGSAFPQAYGQAYGLAIPSNEVQDAYDRMIHKGRPRGYLGVSVDDYPSASYQDGKQPQSAIVLGVEHGSPASAAGLRKDDVVKSLDGLPVRSAAEFFRRLRKKQVGESLSLSVERGAETLTLTTEVANLNTIFASQPTPESHQIAGLRVRELRKVEQTRYPLREAVGVLVEDVLPESPLHGLVSADELVLRVSDAQHNTLIENTAVFLSRMKELETTGGFLTVLRMSGAVDRVPFPKTSPP